MSFHLIICSDSVVVAGLDTLKPPLHLNTSSFTSSQVWSFCLDISGHWPTWHPVIVPPQTHTSCMETREQQQNPATPWLLSSRSPLHPFFFVSLEFRLSSRLHASPPPPPKQNHCSRCCCLVFVFCVFIFRFVSLTWSNVTVSIEYVAGRTPKAQDLLECQWGLPRQDHVMWPMNHLEVILCAHGTHGFFASLSPLHFFLRKQSSFWKCKCIRCLPDFSPCPSPLLLLLPSFCLFCRSLSLCLCFPLLACRGCFKSHCERCHESSKSRIFAR